MKKVMAGVFSIGLLCTSIPMAGATAEPLHVKRGAAGTDASVQVPAPMAKAKQAAATFQSSKSTDYKPGEVIVKFKNNFSAQSLGASTAKFKFQLKQHLHSSNLQVLKFSASSSMADVIQTLNELPQVEYAEPNYILKPSAVADPMFKQMWGFKNTGQVIRGVKGRAGIDIGIESAWAVTKGSPNVTVAVIDTGIDIKHADLKGRIWRNTGEVAGDGIDNDKNGYIDDINGWDFANNDNTVFDAQEGDEHGTHVAGTIAASANDTGVIGVAPNVKIMPLKFLGAYGGDTAAAVAAINYAKDKGVKILSNSWGGYMFSQALYDAIRDSNSLFVAAAGNDGMNNDESNSMFGAYPASFDLPNILSVAAIDHTGNLSWFSNFGETSVDLAAPGTDILSTVPGVMAGDTTAYAYYSGTSMATPHASGVAALLLSKNPALSPLTMKTALMRTVTPLSSLKGKVASKGLLNAGKALAYEPDSDIPGLPLAASGAASGTLDAKTDTDDVYAVNLLKGESITVSLSGATGTDFDVYLYNSKAQLLSQNTHIVAYSEEQGSSSESFTYTATADGTYYVAASAYKGAGKYALTVKSSTGAGVYENTQKELGYSGAWSTVSSDAASGGSYAVAKGTAKMQFVFTGTGVSLTGLKDASQGIVKVTVDGVSKEISLHSADALHKQTFFTKKNLAAGRHVVTVEWTGKAAAGAKRSATAINLDTITVY